MLADAGAIGVVGVVSVVVGTRQPTTAGAVVAVTSYFILHAS